MHIRCPCRIWNCFLFFEQGIDFLLLTCRQRARPPDRPHRRSAPLFEPLPRSFDPPETLHSTLTPGGEVRANFYSSYRGWSNLSRTQSFRVLPILRTIAICTDNDLSLRVQKCGRKISMLFSFFFSFSKYYRSICKCNLILRYQRFVTLRTWNNGM